MKKIIATMILTAALVACNSAKEENLSIATETVSGSTLRSSFKVWGNCDMCKETIEGALRVDGVTEANWNMETNMLLVTYDTTRVNLDQVQKNIAAVGYDNAKYKGDDNAYAKLPECCQYERR